MNINAVDDYGETALIAACAEGHKNSVVQLLKHKMVNVNLQNNGAGLMALNVASSQGHVEVVRELLQHDKVDGHLQDNNGRTALCVASEKGHAEVIRDNKVDSNLQHNNCETALYIVSEEDQVEVIHTDVNLKSNTRSTVLDMAQRSRHGAIANLFEEEKHISNAFQ
jgi:ankyrin repeat protein